MLSIESSSQLVQLLLPRVWHVRSVFFMFFTQVVSFLLLRYSITFLRRLRHRSVIQVRKCSVLEHERQINYESVFMGIEDGDRNRTVHVALRFLMVLLALEF